MKRLSLLGAILIATSIGAQSSNFIIRWGFQDLCHHVFDPITKETLFPTDTKKAVTFDPNDVQPGDLIFARQPQLFFEELEHQITVPYILITHGTAEDAFKPEFMDYLDSANLLAWFTIHPGQEKHPKLFSLPVGIRQVKQYVDKKEHLNNLFQELRTQKKESLLYMNMLRRTHKDRAALVDRFNKEPYCFAGERDKID